MLGRFKTKEATCSNALLLAGKCTLKFAKANYKSNLARATSQFFRHANQRRQPGEPDKNWVKMLAGKDSRNVPTDRKPTARTKTKSRNSVN